MSCSNCSRPVEWIGEVSHADDGDACGEPRQLCALCRRSLVNKAATNLATGRALPRLACKAHNRNVGIVWRPA